MGDLRYGRTVHSLTEALMHFDVDLKFIGPESLRLPRDLREHLAAHGRSGMSRSSTSQEAGDLDVLYMTRIQRERFPDPMDYERVRSAYRVDRAALEPFGEDLKILHPLPRVNEVADDVDDLPGALYFRQTRNGVIVRMALLHLIFGRGRGMSRQPRDFRLTDGTVIDHLPVGTAARALELLGLPTRGSDHRGHQRPEPAPRRQGHRAGRGASSSRSTSSIGSPCSGRTSPSASCAAAKSRRRPSSTCRRV